MPPVLLWIGGWLAVSLVVGIVVGRGIRIAGRTDTRDRHLRLVKR